MDGSSLSESESNTTEPILASSVLGVKGPLRFTRHRSTIKAHVVLRRVEVGDDSSNDEEPARAAYFSLFAQKRIDVKPGKEILLTVEEGEFKGQAIMLQADIIETHDISDVEGKAQVSEEEETPLSLLPKFAVPPKMRKTWTKREILVDETVSIPDPSVPFAIQSTPIVQSQAFSALSKESRSVSIQTDLPERFICEHCGKERPESKNRGPVPREEVKNLDPITNQSLACSQTNKAGDARMDTDWEDEDMELSSNSESETKATEISEALRERGGLLLSASKPSSSPTRFKLDSCKSEINAMTKVKKKVSNPFAGFVTKFVGESQLKQNSGVENATPIPSKQTQTLPSDSPKPNGNNLSRRRASPLPSTNAKASSSKVSLDQLHAKELQDSTSCSVVVATKAANERPGNGPCVQAGTYHNSLGIWPSSLGNILPPSVTAKVNVSRTKKPVKRSSAIPTKPSTSAVNPVDTLSMTTAVSNSSTFSPLLPPPKEESPPPPPLTFPPSPPPTQELGFPATKNSDTKWKHLECVVRLGYPEQDTPTLSVDTKGATKCTGSTKRRKQASRRSPIIKQESGSLSPVTPKTKMLSGNAVTGSRLENSTTSPGSSRLNSCDIPKLSSPVSQPSGTFTPIFCNATLPGSESSLQGTASSSPGAADKRPLPATHLLPPKPVTFSSRRMKREANPIAPQHQKKRKVHPWPTTEPNFTAASLTGDGPLLIKQIEVSGDGTLIALICADRTIRIWDSDNRAEMARLGHNAPIISVAWLESDAGIIAFGGDGIIGQWIRTSQNHWAWGKVVDALDRGVVPNLSISSDECCCMAYTKDLIAISVKNSVKVWQWDRGLWRVQRSITRPNVTALTFMHDGTLLGGTRDGVLWICEVPNGTLRALAFLKGKISHVDVNTAKTSALVTQGTASFLVNLQQEGRGDVERAYSMDGLRIDGFGARFAAQGQGVLFGSSQGCALVWDTKSGNLVYGLDHRVEDDDGIGATASSEASGNRPGFLITGTKSGLLSWWSQPAQR